MAINSTTNLGLALPDQGEWDGTWGTNLNEQITDLIDSAVAGTTTLSADADVTLTDTDFAANQSRQAIILWTASNGATTRNITAPARSKTYVVVNAGTGTIVFRGAGPTTGVTIVAGRRSLIVWNGSDFAEVAGGLVNLATGVTGTLPVANGGTGTASPSLVGGTNVTISGSFPNQTVNVTGGVTTNSIAQLDTSVTVTDGVTSFTASVASSATTVQASQSGTTLTVNVVEGTAPIIVGATISGISFLPNTVVTAFGTGTGGAGTYTVSTSFTKSVATADLVYSTMTVTAVASGTLAVGQKISNNLTASGASLTIPTNTSIIALGTGTGGAGTYILNKVFALNSSTVFAGGSIATVVDGQNVQTIAGGNTLVRTAIQFNDRQGAFLSNRLMGSYVTQSGGPGVSYYADFSSSGTISSADALDLLRLMTTLELGRSQIAAYACAYGSNGPNVGLGFSPYSVSDVLRMSVNLTPSQSVGVVNTVAVGHLSQVGPRITFNKIGVDPGPAGGTRPNTISHVAAEHQFLGGPVSLGDVATITAATSAPSGSSPYVIFNVAGTATVTLQTQNAVIDGRIDDGTNTAAGTTLTVNSVTGQAIFIGMKIYVPGLSATKEYVSVTAFGTGTGGAGTYTVDISARAISTEMFSSGPTAGQLFNIKTIQNQAVNSASANVVPLAGGAAGTAILTATAGKWATLVFDGTDWQIMAAN